MRADGLPYTKRFESLSIYPLATGSFFQLNDGTVILSPKGVSLPETARIVTKLGHPDNQVRENPIELPIT